MHYPLTRLSFVLLAALSAPGARVTAEETAGWFEATITKRVDSSYLLVKPEGYDPQEKYPLIIFLHGKGEEGEDLGLVKTHGPYKKAAELGLRVLIAAPQAPLDEWWDTDTLEHLTEHLLAELPVDPDRVYLTGLSMGGGGTWQLLSRRPELFAAAVPICGWGVPSRAEAIKHVPLWVFHGAKDNVVPVWLSRGMVKALKEAGSSVRYTEYPEAGHDSWTETYNNPELYEWLLSQRRVGADEP